MTVDKTSYHISPFQNLFDLDVYAFYPCACGTAKQMKCVFIRVNRNFMSNNVFMVKDESQNALQLLVKNVGPNFQRRTRNESHRLFLRHN